MFSRPARIGLVVLAFGAASVLAGAQAPQSAPTPPAAATAPAAPAPDLNLSGTWKFDDAAIKDDPRNWRRPVGGRIPLPGAGVGPAPGAPSDRALPGGVVDPADSASSAPSRAPRSAGSLGEPWDSQVRRAIRDLLEVTPLYTITVQPTQVTFVDDLERTFVYMTDGRKEKKRMGGTEFDVRTTWEGNVLRQDIVASQLRMSQAFMLATDQSAMFVWLNVEKPELVPPIKKLARVYVRAK